MRSIPIVERGEYDDHEILAAFEDPRDAQAYADDHNRRERPDYPMLAVVGELPFYPAGTYHRDGQVLDGDVVDQPRAIGR